jgi:hypothetical protein
MPTIRESHCDLVEAPLVASLSTVGADGTPQTAAISIWFVFEGEPADRRIWPRARRVFSSARSAGHLGVVRAAMTVSHWIEHQTGWSTESFVPTVRRYRTVTPQPIKLRVPRRQPLIAEPR